MKVKFILLLAIFFIESTLSAGGKQGKFNKVIERPLDYSGKEVAELSHGVNVNAVINGTGRTALHEIANIGSRYFSSFSRETIFHIMDIANSLIAAGADIYLKDRVMVETPLQLCIPNNNIEVARILLQKAETDKRLSEYVNIKDGSGKSALHLAAMYGEKNMIKMLVEAGANINERCLSGMTPLLLAIFNGHDAAAILLLRAGANALITDNEGKNALTIGNRFGFKNEYFEKCMKAEIQEKISQEEKKA